MCDYCGCRRSGPSSELAAGHERLLELGDVLHTALHDGTDVSDVFDQFVRLLQMHAAKEEVGLFVHAMSSTPLGDRIDALCSEHDPEQWDDIELAHRAVEAVWDEPIGQTGRDTSGNL
jgi:hypothetical protein